MSNEKDKSKGSDFEWMLELMKKEHEKFLERVKGMPEPKYVKGDVVRFGFRDGEVIEGMIEIVDRYGTFDRTEGNRRERRTNARRGKTSAGSEKDGSKDRSRTEREVRLKRNEPFFGRTFSSSFRI